MIALQLGRRRLGGVATRAKGSFAPRHGKAIEPVAWRPAAEEGSKADGKQNRTKQDGEMRGPGAEVLGDGIGGVAAAGGGTAAAGGTAATAAVVGAAAKSSKEPDSKTMQAAQAKTTKVDAQLDTPPPSQAHEPSSPSSQPDTPTKTPLVVEQTQGSVQMVLANGKGMAPPPYVHHFDSYSLVKQLHGGGYSEAQATTAMKGIRALLAQNLDVAQQSLVSKSDVENTYLFSAACSELSAEIKNNRRLRDEQMRQQRTHLQHEVDILTQSLNQELLTLNDNNKRLLTAP
ncbi:hypothetical protein CDD82_5908 [Ophiocordyceps australis]|uniref:Uncharacterized protein n=1 Tax=Ophiocordyceps australis TaxID=1399860 RepID=A0A2C5Z088_9HYPO|nr:hypothetical protein CDD82_5908 [Ophiocordyceps australis]